MTHPSLAWTDSEGAASLVCQGLTFMNWTPDVHDYGDSQVPVGSGTTHFFAYRQDFTVSFDVAQIPVADLPLALRLKSHLVTGGEVTINTEDTDSHVYTATLDPGSVPSLTMTDTVAVEYTLHLDLVNESLTPFSYTPVEIARGDTLTLVVGPLTFSPPCTPSTADLTATYLDRDGNPHVGATINFVSNLEGSFTVSPDSGITNSSGQLGVTVTAHLPGTGSVHAVAGSLIASVAVTVEGCGWHEPFQQADYTEFYADYAASTHDNLSDDLAVPADEGSGVIVFTGTQMQFPGQSTFLYAQQVFSPPSFGCTEELWARLVVEVAGDTWDDTAFPDPSVGYETLPIQFDVWNSVGNSANAGLAFVPIHPVPQARDFYVYSNGTTSAASGFDVHLAVGTHTFIFCVSNPDSTTLRIEMWIDQAPGDAPLATADSVKVAGDAFNEVSVYMEAPYTSGRSIAFDDAELVCGSRAFNPFGMIG